MTEKMWRGAANAPREAVDPDKLLRNTLMDISANIAELIPPEKMEAPVRAIEELRASGIEQRGLKIGAKAPVFSLRDQKGRTNVSTELLARGRLIVTFFRGRWDPYDSATVEAWQAYTPQIKASGVSFVAITPQTLHHVEINAEQHKLTFPVLSDPGNATAKAFGIVWRVPDYLQAHYRRVFINLPQVNGDDSWELPLPAAYVIDRDGSIIYAEAHADWRERPEPREILGMAAEATRA